MSVRSAACLTPARPLRKGRERDRRRRLAGLATTWLVLAALAPSAFRAEEARPAALAILPIKLLDTSGEPTDQSGEHAARLAHMADLLAADLTRAGRYRAAVLPAEQLHRACPSGEGACLLRTARAEGAERIFIGVVHKSSTLILQLWARLVDTRTERDVFSRDLNFRGDTDEAWQRAERFLVTQIQDASPSER